MAKKVRSIPSGKRLAVLALYLLAGTITATGAYFSFITAVNGVSFPVLSSQVPGFVFGLIIVYLGLRYLLAVHNLQKQVYQSSVTFAWRNFY